MEVHRRPGGEFPQYGAPASGILAAPGVAQSVLSQADPQDLSFAGRLIDALTEQRICRDELCASRARIDLICGLAELSQADPPCFRQPLRARARSLEEELQPSTHVFPLDVRQIGATGHSAGDDAQEAVRMVLEADEVECIDNGRDVPKLLETPMPFFALGKCR
eukprot:scaffold733_cov267-Pinguiococcus_pyrenoidosus.AAC.54